MQLRQKDLELQLAEVRRKESDEVARDFQVRAAEFMAVPAAPLLLWCFPVKSGALSYALRNAARDWPDVEG